MTFRFPRILPVLLVVACASFANATSAQMLQDQGPPSRRVLWSTFIAARYNPLGIGAFNTLRLRQRLYKHENKALRDNYAGLGLMLGLNPVRTRLGILAEASPMTPLRFWASFEAMAWQPILGIRSYPDAKAEWNNSIVNELLSGQNTSYGSVGFYATFGADAQIQIGPVALRAFLKALRSDVVLRNGDRLFYDANLDAQLPAHGWTLTSDVDVLGLIGPFIVGLRGTLTHPLYDDAMLGRAPGDKASLVDRFWIKNGPAARIGPLVAWKMYQDDGALFNSPTVAMILQWHIHHRYRSGADPNLFVPAPFSAAVPYLAVAFTGFGDFLSVK